MSRRPFDCDEYPFWYPKPKGYWTQQAWNSMRDEQRLQTLWEENRRAREKGQWRESRSQQYELA